MRISYNQLKQYVTRLPAPEKLVNLLTQTGLEVGALTKKDPWGEKIVVGQLVSIKKHPHADRLWLTQVDVGQAAPQQIICGAQNLALQKKVVVALPGASLLPVGSAAPLSIKTRKVRGLLSEGMICSRSELGFSTIGSEEGIWLIDTKHAPGTLLRTLPGLEPDHLFEIDLTPNRADAASHLGVARDIAAALGRKIVPPIQAPLVASEAIKVQLHVRAPKACLRYVGVVIKGVSVAASPPWLQHRLHMLGLKPVNNVVDITQYLLHAMGQPLHVYDYEQIQKKSLSVAYAHPNTSFAALDGNTYPLTGHELMVCDDLGPLAMAGIIGGERAKVLVDTTDLFLESAYYAPEVITKTVQQLHLHTDASYRFERGTDPNMVYQALQQAVHMIQEIAGGHMGSSVVEYYPEPIGPTIIQLPYAYLHQVVGRALPIEEVVLILQNLDIVVKKTDDQQLTAAVPPYRVDVKRPIDLIEEILRIYGYNHPKLKTSEGLAYCRLQASRPLKPTDRLHHTRLLLAAQGYREIITNPLGPSPQKWLPPEEAKQLIHIVDPLSNRHTTLRPDLFFSGLEAVKYNLDRGYSNLKLFEVGKIYLKQSGKYRETDRLGLWLTGETQPKNWQKNNRPTLFADLHGVVLALLNAFGVTSKLDRVTKEETTNIYKQALIFQYESKEVVTLGIIAPAVCAAYGIKQPLYYASIAWEILLKLPVPLPRYQQVSNQVVIYRDLSLWLPPAVSFEMLKKEISACDIPYLKGVDLLDVYEGTSNHSTKHRSYTLRLAFQHPRKTFTQKELDHAIKRISERLTAHLSVDTR